MAMPSRTRWGSKSQRRRSLKVPGSDSSALMARYRGPPSPVLGSGLGRKDHLRPVGKPAPPRPRTWDFLTSSTMASGVIFFLKDTATTEIYTLSLHDALPI